MTRILAWLKPRIHTDLLWVAILAMGVILRVRQYAENLSLSGDEASLALNIIGRSFAGLTRLLDYHQGAPAGFLFVEKLLYMLLGGSDLVPRLFPFLCGLAAMYFMYRVAGVHYGFAGFVAVLAFAISVPLIFYSSYLKQYSGDVMITLLLVYLAGRCVRSSPRNRDFVLLGVTGVAGIWLSHPSFFVLAGIGLTMLFLRWDRRSVRSLIWPLGLGGVWLLAFGLSYLLSARELATNAYLAKYWHYAFMPWPPWVKPAWFVDTYLALLNIMLRRTDLVFAWTCLMLLMVGTISIFIRDRLVALLTLSPFFIALAASALQQYPLDDRFLLFLVPLVFLLIAEGVGCIFSFISRWSRPLAAITIGALLLFMFFDPALAAFRNFRHPARPWDVRPVMQYVSQHWQKTDIVYVSGGGQASLYYSTLYGLDRPNLILKTTHRIIPWWNFRNKLVTFAGQDRVWIVFAHMESPKDDRYGKFIQRMGTVVNEFESSDARAFLVDMNP